MVVFHEYEHVYVLNQLSGDQFTTRSLYQKINNPATSRLDNTVHV